MTEPMKTAEEVLEEEFQWGMLADMQIEDIHRAMKIYAAQQVAAERERIKKVLRFRITFWNSATQEKEPKYSYKSIFGLIDSL